MSDFYGESLYWTSEIDGLRTGLINELSALCNVSKKVTYQEIAKRSKESNVESIWIDIDTQNVQAVQKIKPDEEIKCLYYNLELMYRQSNISLSPMFRVRLLFV